MRYWLLILVSAAAVFGLLRTPAPVVNAQEFEAVRAGRAGDHSAHGGHEEDLGHGNAGPQLNDASEFKTDLAIYTFVVFLLLLAILGKFAWPTIIRALEAREKHIADQIAAAEACNQEAKRLLAEHEAKLAAAAGEVRALLEEARRDADVTRKRIEEDGRKAAGEELARATREIQRAKEGAIQDLAVASANTAIELARKVVRDGLTNDQQSQLVREALGKLAATTPSKN